MKRYGIYGSSFDPITEGHMFTANTVRYRRKLDHIIFAPTSQKGEKRLKTSDDDRKKMVELAIQNGPVNKYGEPSFIIDTHEMEAPMGHTHTYHTMRYFREKYPEDELFFIMGADLLLTISKWANAEELIKNTKFIVMSRNGIDMVEVIAKDPLLRKYEENFDLMHKGIAMEISSSYIREEFEMGGDPRYLLPEACYEYIKQNGLYKRNENE